jgi:flagellar hook-basal body complex protein FliE
MAIPMVSSGSATALAGIQRTAATEATAATAATTATQGASSFGDLVAHGVQNLDATQHAADAMATQAATGDLSDMHDYLIAATKASIATDLTVAVRNKAVDSFNEIMRMQI